MLCLLRIFSLKDLSTGFALNIRGGAVQVTACNLATATTGLGVAALQVWSATTRVAQSTFTAPAGGRAIALFNGGNLTLDDSQANQTVYFGTLNDNTLLARHTHLSLGTAGQAGTKTCLAVTTDAAFYGGTACP